MEGSALLDPGGSTDGDLWCINQLGYLARAEYTRIIVFFQELV